jgi:hypothetical protein
MFKNDDVSVFAEFNANDAVSAKNPKDEVATDIDDVTAF